MYQPTTLSDRKKYKQLLAEEKSKPNPNPQLVEEYNARQITAKLLCNAGAGLYADKHFHFHNYKVNQLITAEGRRIHKMMEEIGTKPPYNFKVFFGFTDSTFFSDVKSPELITQFIQYFKDKLNVTIELKDVYVNSIFYGKKNQSVEWNDKETDRPIIKNPGNSRAQCKWVRKWFVDIVTEIVKHPETRFEKVPIMLKQAYADLKYIIDSGLFSQLKFTETMNQELNAYEENNRIRLSTVHL